MITSLAMLAFLLFTLPGLAIDDRTSLGVPIWLKPTKFAISIAIYSVTLAWLVSLLKRGRRTGFWLGTIAAVAVLIEMAIIGGQAARGVRSHFNNTTELNATLFSIMGATIVVVWLATLWVGVLLLIQRVSDRPASLAIRLGIFIALAGMAVGFIMVAPTSAQLAADTGFQGAHAVGVEDGGPGLPLVGWSTEGGDLRAGHFLGMHALQALPLLALLLSVASRRIARLRDETTRTQLVGVAGIAYAALVALVTWQALRGQSIAGPDALSLAGYTLIFMVVLVGGAWSLRRKEKLA
jgi:uncharacterized membrane protein YhaH (DUF805 family)